MEGGEGGIGGRDGGEGGIIKGYAKSMNYCSL